MRGMGSGALPISANSNGGSDRFPLAGGGFVPQVADFARIFRQIEQFAVVPIVLDGEFLALVDQGDRWIVVGSWPF